jgi:hypothetical protein
VPIFSFLLWTVLGFELGASHLPGRSSSMHRTAVLYESVVLWIGSPVSALVSLNFDSLTPPYWLGWQKPPFPDYWLRWGLINFLPGLASNFDPPNVHLPSKWDYRCELLYPTKIVIFEKKSMEQIGRKMSLLSMQNVSGISLHEKVEELERGK